MDVTCKYTRGSVWYGIDVSTENKFMSTDHLQRGNRLFIVFSSDMGNVTNPNVSVIPLSTKTQKKLSVNVPIRGYDGIDEIALCNMLQPIPKENLIEYRYSLSESAMKKVEEGVLIANDMKKYMQSADISYTFDQLESVIQSIVKRRVETILKDNKEKATRVTAVDISNMVESLLPEAEKDIQDAIENSTCKATESILVDDIAQYNERLRRLEGGRRVWTADRCKLFIADRDTKGKAKTAQLWGIKPSSVQTTYFNCKKRLTNF